ncbi:MAG: YncE family protein [Muribaculaceae bacterium]
MNKSLFISFIFFLPLLMVSTGCRDDELVVPTEYDIVGEAPVAGATMRGFYVLNEGNMGSNKCTIDYMDYFTGLYARNIYPERNPTVVKELGDVGNDIAIYGSKLYAVINCSHKVEVMDAATGVSLGRVDIPNCRYITFYRGDAYVSSYVGPVLIDPDAPKGAVYKVDTLTLTVKDRVTVGYQPEEMAIVDDYMYVANSGGYRAPNYDNTLSVIQLVDFKQTQQIPVGINLHRCRRDRYGKLWVSSRGNYADVPSRLYVLDKKPGYNKMLVVDTIDVACSEMAFRGDSLYFYATEWNNFSASNTITYGIIDIRTHKVVADNFISDGSESDITVPYGIAIHPDTGDILVTDAKNYVSSGALYCYDSRGRRKWSVRTGDIPAHIVFLPLSLCNQGK